MKIHKIFSESRLAIALAFALFMQSSAVLACTAFAVSTPTNLLMAKNFDWNQGHGLVFLNKRQMSKKAFVFKAKERGAQWVSRWGSATFNLAGKEFPFSGINEQGLTIEILLNEVPQATYPLNELPTVNESQFIQYLLDTAADLPEALLLAQQVRISPFYNVGVHYLVCDHNKTCATIEFLEHQMVVHQGNQLPVKVLSNNPYAEGIEFLKLHAGFGGELPIPKGNASNQRFVRAAWLLSLLPESSENINPAPTMWSVLESVKQKGTQWQLLYDALHQVVYFKTAQSTSLKWFSLKDSFGDCQTAVQVLDINDPFAGDNDANFKTYQEQHHLDLLAKTDFIPGPLKEVLKEYPQKSTKCLLSE